MEYKDIFDAIKANDIEAVKSFLPEHANDKDKYGYTALVYTICFKGNKEMFDLLLDNGADPQDLGEVGDSILDYLWIENWPDKIQTLVDHGLDIHSTNPSLMITDICRYLGRDDAFFDKKLAFLKELIRCGGRTDIPDEKGKLPLDYLPKNLREEIEKKYIANREAERLGNIAHETGFAYDI